jgi:hypothetical protein
LPDNVHKKEMIETNTSVEEIAVIDMIEEIDMNEEVIEMTEIEKDRDKLIDDKVIVEEEMNLLEVDQMIGIVIQREEIIQDLAHNPAEVK